MASVLFYTKSKTYHSGYLLKRTELRHNHRNKYKDHLLLCGTESKRAAYQAHPMIQLIFPDVSNRSFTSIPPRAAL